MCSSDHHARPPRLPIVLACVWVLACATRVWAHPVPFSYLDLQLDRTHVSATLVVHVFDAAHDLGVDPPERLLDPAILSHDARSLTDLLLPRLSIRADGRSLVPRVTSVDPLMDRRSLRLTLAFPELEAPPTAIDVEARLFPYDGQHETFVNVHEGSRLTQAILDSRQPRVEYIAGSGQTSWKVIQRFVPAGVEHIWTGPDHLLFLLALLLPGGTVRRLAAIVTAFTIAHSITLSLAVFNLVTPPPSVIEPAIALSIMYAGADNLLARDGRDLRVLTAFGFGFIHGFGFASVLREMGLPAGALGWSLFSFNLGVEIGQLVIVLAVAAALQLARSRRPTWSRPLTVAGSSVVIAAGAFWFVQRVWFPGGMS